MENQNSNPQIFEAEYDEEGVYFYQAYCDEIANYAIEHQTFGGELFNPLRMTWIKPSFAWMLYRAGYGTKHNQERILKIKISHKSLSELLNNCTCKDGGGGSFGRVQWDPARDLFTCENGEPRKMLNKRAIQIGLKGCLSALYVKSIISIEDYTELAHLIGITHGVFIINNNGILVKNKKRTNILFADELLKKLPKERKYIPLCDKNILENLGLIEGLVANNVAKLGKGKCKLLNTNH